MKPLCLYDLTKQLQKEGATSLAISTYAILDLTEVEWRLPLERRGETWLFDRYGMPLKESPSVA